MELANTARVLAKIFGADRQTKQEIFYGDEMSLLADLNDETDFGEALFSMGPIVCSVTSSTPNSLFVFRQLITLVITLTLLHTSKSPKTFPS